MSLSFSFKTELWLIIDYTNPSSMKGRKRHHSCERPASQTALCCFKCSVAYLLYGQSSHQLCAVQQKTAWQSTGAALMKPDMRGYEWLHLRGNCRWAEASYLVPFSLLAIYGWSLSQLYTGGVWCKFSWAFRWGWDPVESLTGKRRVSLTTVLILFGLSLICCHRRKLSITQI